MKNYTYQNLLIGKKQLKQILAWSFSNYGSVQACFLADELKDLGFKYATQAGLSISIEDLQVPFAKQSILIDSKKKLLNTEKSYLKGKITEIEKFQKIIDSWNFASEFLKEEVISYFRNYDPLNSVYMMAFSGARGNVSQVRQLVGMRGLMSDPSGQIMNLAIKKNFREGLTITDYLMSGYGARKGIVDTALKTANSGYLTRRLIDVAQDIIIREKDCLTTYSFLFNVESFKKDIRKNLYNQLLGKFLNKPIYDLTNSKLIANANTPITIDLIRVLKQKHIFEVYIRSPFTCCLYRSICQKCYGWNLAKENIVDLGEAVGILAGQSIGEPGTQLTMRTFHTGGIFTSALTEQIVSPIDGIIEFSKFLKTITVRTNRGENVLLTENSGFLIIQSNNNTLQIELPRNTILFYKNNQFVKKHTIIGQSGKTLKQTLTETKYITSSMSGEIFVPNLNLKCTSTTVNKLLWLLAGQVYSAPLYSFLNFHSDYKINKNNFIFRSKIVNRISGYMNVFQDPKTCTPTKIEILKILFYFSDIKFYKFVAFSKQLIYLVKLNNLIYSIKFLVESSNLTKLNNLSYTFGNLITNKFKTLTGGTPYYTQEINRINYSNENNKINFYNDPTTINHQTITWLNEETYFVDCEIKSLLVNNHTFIPKRFEIIPNLFSKTMGILELLNKENVLKRITIRSGYLYEVSNIDNIENFANQIVYPGELLFNQIHINSPCLIEIIEINSTIQLLLRPLEIYEIPFDYKFKKENHNNLNNNFKNHIAINYKPSVQVPDYKSIELITNWLNYNLNIQTATSFYTQTDIKLDIKKKIIKVVKREKLNLNEYLPADLKYSNYEFSLIAKNNHFLNQYSIIGYLQIKSTKSLEIVKLKSKSAQKREIFLISNDDCIILPKSSLKNKQINQLLIDSSANKKTGRIIIDNNQYLTIQKGRPYFFPNCKNSNFLDESLWQYKLVLAKNHVQKNQLEIQSNLNIQYYDITNKLIPIFSHEDKNMNLAFKKMIIKKQGKFYISGVPIFLRELLIKRKKNNLNILPNLPKTASIYNSTTRKFKYKYFMFVKSSGLKNNLIKFEAQNVKNFASLLLLKYPFSKLGIHSITDDFYEQEVNSVYCKSGEFIQTGKTIGLLNFEKEITGDIVQGLPRVEELLEARKKKKFSARISKNKKKGLLIRKTSLDPSFEFRKLGTTIKNTDRINPHNLLKIYFNYYAKAKILVHKNNLSSFIQLTSLYEASYRSFKKVQLLILQSIQSVYKSQGVTIADKHIEIIIKQMTSKVQITRSGDTPLLPHEIIDLYHIKYINEIMSFEKHQLAYYVPLVLGVTKASLNNPSFISAASFQETTRVLTKAAIEGRYDWLRGLKENIVIGQLIPAGTGAETYYTFFEKQSISDNHILSKFKSSKTFFLKV